jgi:hypothetical protein
LRLVGIILIDITMIKTHFFGQCYSSVHDVVVCMMYFLVISGVAISDCIVDYYSSQ